MLLGWTRLKLTSSMSLINRSRVSFNFVLELLTSPIWRILPSWWLKSWQTSLRLQDILVHWWNCAHFSNIVLSPMPILFMRLITSLSAPIVWLLQGFNLNHNLTLWQSSWCYCQTGNNLFPLYAPWLKMLIHHCQNYCTNSVWVSKAFSWQREIYYSLRTSAARITKDDCPWWSTPFPPE